MTDEKITQLDDHRPHNAGQIICVHCLHEWTAVWPEVTSNLECPNCSEMTTTDPEAKYKALYHDLIFCVESKWPDESRHDTAKRYIHERESGPAQCASAETHQESDLTRREQ